MRSFSIAMVLLGSLLATPPGSVRAQEILTNQSIVEMVKAGLSERVIVAKIRTSPTNFDVRTDALIALKKNGVPEKVIEAILSPSAPAASADSSTSPGAPPPGSVAAVPPAMSQARARPTVFQLVAGKEVELMAAGTELQTNRAPYSRSSELVLPGNKAKYRTPDRQPLFVITSEPNEMPLVRLEPGKDDRNLKIGSGSRVPYGGGSSRRGIRGEDVVDVDAERDSRGFYRIRPRAPLAPGEYGFVFTRGGGSVGGSVYDFGVD